MSKKRILIDDNKCVGCGLCANTCQQSAIEMVNGKAKVVHEDYCDGIGNCLPVCPVSAISFSEGDDSASNSACTANIDLSNKKTSENMTQEIIDTHCTSQLNQWPVQIKLVPTSAPYFDQAHLLIAADCTAYTYPDFHETFMKNRATVIGCPKLDMQDYTEKLTEILKNNTIQSVTVARMQVPCCGGIEYAAEQAIKQSGKSIPYVVKTISLKGEIM